MIVSPRSGLGQVRAVEQAVQYASLLQDGPGEVAIAEAAVDQLAVIKVQAVQLRFFEIHADELHAVEICSAQVHGGKVFVPQAGRKVSFPEFQQVSGLFEQRVTGHRGHGIYVTYQAEGIKAYTFSLCPLLNRLPSGQSYLQRVKAALKL